MSVRLVEERLAAVVDKPSMQALQVLLRAYNISALSPLLLLRIADAALVSWAFEDGDG